MFLNWVLVINVMIVKNKIVLIYDQFNWQYYFKNNFIFDELWKGNIIMDVLIIIYMQIFKYMN